MDNLFNGAKYNLFESRIKVASKKVSNNPSEWAKQSIEYFYDQFPQFMGKDINIRFKERDPKKGYAVGSITAGPFSVPVLIKGGVIAPYDVAIRQDGITVPFNEEVINMTMGGTTAFMQLDPRPKDFANYGKIDRSLAYAAGVPDEYGVKTGQRIDRLAEADCIHTSDKKRIAQVLREDNNARWAYESNEDATEAIGKIAKAHAVEDIDAHEKLSEHIERDIYFVEKVGNFDWELTLGCSQWDDPVTISIPEEEAIKLPSYKTAPREKTAEVYPNMDKLGIALPINTGDSLFITENGDYMHISGVSVPKEPNEKVAELGVMPKSGDTGLFVIQTKSGSYLGVSEPFEVRNVVTTGNSMKVAANDIPFNTEFEVIRKEFDAIEPHETEKNAYYVPGNAIFVKLGNKLDQDQVIYKSASLGAHKISAFGKNQYHWDSPVLEKYAERYNLGEGNHSWKETVWAMLQCGADGEMIEKMSNLRDGRVMIVENDLYLPPKLEKLAEKLVEADALDENWVGTDYWVKLAAWMPSPDSIDAILSLNFLNKNTIKEFIDLLPSFEECANELARLLLSVRMGMRDMDPTPISEAISALSKVIAMLHGAKNVRKTNATVA